MVVRPAATLSQPDLARGRIPRAIAFSVRSRLEMRVMIRSWSGFGWKISKTPTRPR
jgi:hypothetical protein